MPPQWCDCGLESVVRACSNMRAHNYVLFFLYIFFCFVIHLLLLFLSFSVVEVIYGIRNSHSCPVIRLNSIATHYNYSRKRRTATTTTTTTGTRTTVGRTYTQFARVIYNRIETKRNKVGRILNEREVEREI